VSRRSKISLELIGTYQLLFYDDDLLGEKINTAKKAEILLDASRFICTRNTQITKILP
jgi:hypothetical protein